MRIRLPTLTLKPIGNVTRSPKHWYQRLDKKDLCPLKILKDFQWCYHYHDISTNMKSTFIHNKSIRVSNDNFNLFIWKLQVRGYFVLDRNHKIGCNYIIVCLQPIWLRLCLRLHPERENERRKENENTVLFGAIRNYFILPVSERINRN